MATKEHMSLQNSDRFGEAPLLYDKANKQGQNRISSSFTEMDKLSLQILKNTVMPCRLQGPIILMHRLKSVNKFHQHVKDQLRD